MKAIPAYAEWRAALLANLAFARMDNWRVFSEPQGGQWDFEVTINDNIKFLVELKATSSLHSKIRNLKTSPRFTYVVSETLISRARKAGGPVFLFLFDVDAEVGRYLRLDKPADWPTLKGDYRLSIPKENIITPTSLKRLAQTLMGKTPNAPVKHHRKSD